MLFPILLTGLLTKRVSVGPNMHPCLSEQTVKVIRGRQNAYVSNCRAFRIRLSLNVSCFRSKSNGRALKLLPFCSLQVTSRTPSLSILVSFCVNFFQKKKKKQFGWNRFPGTRKSFAFVSKNILILLQISGRRQHLLF